MLAADHYTRNLGSPCHSNRLIRRPQLALTQFSLCPTLCVPRPANNPPFHHAFLPLGRVHDFNRVEHEPQELADEYPRNDFADQQDEVTTRKVLLGYSLVQLLGFIADAIGIMNAAERVKPLNVLGPTNALLKRPLSAGVCAALLAGFRSCGRRHSTRH